MRSRHKYQPLHGEDETDSSSSQAAIALHKLERSSDEDNDTKFLIESETTSPVGELPPPIEIQWTEEEEKSLVRKLDTRVMLLLMLAFFALQLDRGNIGNALTDYFLEDVGITQNEFNVGQQLLSLGIVLWEIPSNFVLYYIGPSFFLSGQIMAWGSVAVLQSLQHGLGAFLTTRFLLGSCESGLIPAGLFTITRWYKNEETSKRFSWFFMGNMFAQAISGVAAYGILHMRGIFGLAGWKWLFIIEGSFSISVGLIFISLFPRDAAHPVSLAGVRYFSERESEILVKRVLLDDPSKRQNGESITGLELRRTLTNWRLVPHVILTIAGLSPIAVFWSYGPSLVKGWGYGRLRSNAMVSIGQWIQLVLNIAWGTLADRFRLRGPVVLAAGFIWWIFALCCRLLVYDPNGRTRFAILILAYAFSSIWHPVNGSWMSLNAESAGERSITMAILIMSANTAGIIGSQLFQESDAPLYPIGWTAIVLLVSISLAAMIVANIQYRVLNRQLREEGKEQRYHY